MFFGPNGLDTEGIAGPAERSRLVRPVSCRGPLWGDMARTDGARVSLIAVVGAHWSRYLAHSISVGISALGRDLGRCNH
jgi:hypothetical protein